MLSSLLRLTTNVNKQLSRKLQSWQQPEGFNTGIQIYNCVTRGNVPLILRNEDFASWYTCGPTVYDSSHIGHASCYVKLDILQRVLKNYFKINLVTAMNITDIDDKIIVRSMEEKSSWEDIARKFEHEFWTDLKKLNVLEPNIKIRVTQNISTITEFIEKIVNKGLAYVAKDNSVYFKVKSFPNYGKLQRLNLEEEQKHDVKDSSFDFALWKAKKEGEPSWESVWGPGRPGWHIECSALGTKLFGSTIDFHAGGMDLKFPHHENEEAQSCGFHNKTQWVNYWIHTGHLNLMGDDEKMSKSLRNTISINELLKDYSSDEFRMACLLSNYRNSMEFSSEMMDTARNTLKKFKDFDIDCQAYIEGIKGDSNVDYSTILHKLEKTRSGVDEFLRTDFNTAGCVGSLSDLTTTVSKEMNSSKIPQSSRSRYVDVIAAANNYSKDLLQMFGFQLTREVLSTQEEPIDYKDLINKFLIIRGDIRHHAMSMKNKDLFRICDRIRNLLKEKGIEIKDHSKGSTWILKVK